MSNFFPASVAQTKLDGAWERCLGLTPDRLELDLAAGQLAIFLAVEPSETPADLRSRLGADPDEQLRIETCLTLREREFLPGARTIVALLYNAAHGANRPKAMR